MNWRGIPFNFLESDAIQQTLLNVNHIPEMVIKTDFAYDTFFSGIFAGLIPALVAIWAMHSNSKNLSAERVHQQELANKNITAQIVSASRQVWINDLRDSGAQFLGGVTAVLNSYNACVSEIRRGGSGSELYLKLVQQQRDEKSKLGLLKTKITLLLNPEEESSKTIILAMDDLRKFMQTPDGVAEYKRFDDLEPLSRVFRLSIYRVVKDEWRKLKGDVVDK